MKKKTNRRLSLLLAVVLALGLIIPSLAATAYAASLGAKITTSNKEYVSVNGVSYSNSSGMADISGYKNVKWLCMKPAGKTPAVGNSFSVSEVYGVYRSFAWLAENTTDRARLWLIHQAVSQYNGTGNGIFFDAIKAVYNEGVNYDQSKIPDNFIVFRADPITNSRDQICLMWTYQPTGKVTLTKSSANPALTDGNSCYSLGGAVYGIYGSESDALADRSRLGTLTTDANGNSGSLELKAGTYWRRELVAPKGYALDSRAYSFTVNSGQTTTLRVTDNPQSDPVGVLLKKLDATSGDGEMR